MTNTIYLTPDADRTRVFESFFFRWNRIFFRAVKSIVPNFDFDLTRDICQQVWTEVWQGIVHERYKYLSVGLLLTKASSRIIDYIRRTDRHRQFDDSKDYSTPQFDRDRMIDYQMALATIPEHERTVVLLKVRYGYTEHEIAEQQHVSARTVRRRLVAGEARLREFFGGGGGNHHAAK